ncbi:MAG: hypothetical protein U0797_08715 [Gemmataceae bacterium]
MLARSSPSYRRGAAGHLEGKTARHPAGHGSRVWCRRSPVPGRSGGTGEKKSELIDAKELHA